MSRQILKLSSHLLERYEVCPRYFDFTTNQLFEAKDPYDAFVMGKLAHKLLHSYYQGIINGLEQMDSLDQTMQLAESKIILEDEFDSITLEQKSFIITTVKDYAGFYISDPLIARPLEAEKLLSKIIYEDDKCVILFEGTTDLIFENRQGNVFPMDHKTESAKRKMSGLNTQFLAYPFLLECEQIYRNALGLQKTKQPQEKFYREMYSFPKATINKWKDNTIKMGLKIIKSYEENDWEAHYSMCEGNPIHRGGCIFDEVCRMSEVNWAYELETNFKKVEGLYYG